MARQSDISEMSYTQQTLSDDHIVNGAISESRDVALRPLKKKMKSDGSVDRDIEIQSGHCEMIEVEEGDLFKDCRPIDGETKGPNRESSAVLEIKDILISMKSDQISMKSVLQGDISDLRNDMKGEISGINKKLENVESVVQNVKIEVKSEVENINGRVDKFMDRLENSERMIEELSLRMTNQEVVTRNMSSDISSRNKIIEMLGDKIVDLEARGRRNNAIVQGIPEQQGEITELVVERWCREYCKITDTVNIQRAHRLGDHRRAGPRPIIVLFGDYRDKEKVKKAKTVLPSSMHVSDDLPYAVRLARRELQAEAKEYFDKGYRTHIAYPARLIANGREIRRVEPKFVSEQQHNQHQHDTQQKQQYQQHHQQHSFQQQHRQQRQQPVNQSQQIVQERQQNQQYQQRHMQQQLQQQLQEQQQNANNQQQHQQQQNQQPQQYDQQQLQQQECYKQQPQPYQQPPEQHRHQQQQHQQHPQQT